MRLFLSLAFVFVLSSCVTSNTMGAIPSASQQVAVVVGKSSQADVLLALGKPTSTLDLGDGRSKLSWIKEITHTRVVPLIAQSTETREATEFWVILKGNLVVDKGFGPTEQRYPLSLQ
ncbi:MAG: hypothetical protein RL095_448 [Verrucomicrobiota bacterium]|jgi:hypothetical protein